MQLFDSLINFVTGLGTSRDKAAHAQHLFIEMDRAQLEQAYRGDWIARKCIDIPAQDATREWREWQAPREDITSIENVERALFIKQKVRMALTLARLYGGAVIVIGTDDSDPALPLDPARVRKGGLKFIHTLSRWEVNAGPLILDITSEWYGEPEYYTRTTADPRANLNDLVQFGPTVKIHPSRVVRFLGNPRPPEIAMMSDPWGDSILQVVNDAVRGAGLVIGGISSMVQEATVDVYRIPDFSEMIVNKAYQDRMTQRFTYANLGKSINNALMLDKEEEWERVSTNFSTLPDLINTYLQIAAGAADIPATRFISQSPKGLNATGDSDTRNYYDKVGSEQRNELQPALSRLDAVITQTALGTTDPSIFYTWKPLWQMDETQKATIALQKAQAFQIDVTAGMVDPLALKEGRENQLIEDGTYPGFEQALEDAALIASYGPEDYARVFGPPEPEPPQPLVLSEGQRVVNPPQRVGDALPQSVIKKRSRFLGQRKTLADALGWELTELDDAGNPFHKGKGPGGGQFTSGGGGGGYASALMAKVPDATKTADEIIDSVPGAREKINRTVAELGESTPTSANVKDGGFVQDNGEYTPERAEIHQQLLAKVFTPEAIARAKPAEGKRPYMALLGGRPGSGKSLLTRPSGPAYPGDAIFIEPDAFKTQLPEYKGYNSQIVHEESKHITDLAAKIAQKAGLNVVFESTFRSESSPGKRIAQFAGSHDIRGYYMHAPPQQAATQAIERFMRGGETGRYVPVQFILNQRENEHNFDKLTARMSHWAVYDNTGKGFPRLAGEGGSR